VYNTGLTGTSNAFAFDNTRNHFFFIDAAKNLNFWDRGSAFTQIATAANIGLSIAGQPANAAFYDNAYWFFNDGTSTLNKISLIYNGSIPSFGSRTTYTIAGTPGTNNRFGDIAITSAGMMYAATSG
jgi:hypothetical protein